MSNKVRKFLNIILTCIGINYLHVSKERFVKIKYIWQWWNIGISLVMISGAIYFIINHWSSLDEFAEGISVEVVSLMIFFLLFCHMVNKDQMHDMVDRLILSEYESEIKLVSYIVRNGVLGEKTAELMDYLKQTRAQVFLIARICMILLSTVFFSTGFLFDFSPIVLGYLYPETHYREFPLKLQYPWNEQNTPIYQIEYVTHVYITKFVDCVFVGTYTLTTLLVGHIIRQLKIVKFIMSNLEELASELGDYDNGKWETNCEIILANCVRHYVDLKRYCHTLNTTFKPFFLAVSFGSAFVLCLCMYMIATAESLLNPRNLRILFMGSAATFQLGLVCVQGQQLINESGRLQICVGGRWWLHGRRHRSSIKIFQVALQRPITMYIFGSIDLSYATFGTFVRSSMSYFTMLLSVTEK